MIGTDPLAGRTLSAFPLSVATSLAFESIFETTTPSIDPDRKIFERVDIGKYDEFWINLSTLFRNIMGALSKEDSHKVGASGLKETLEFEMDTIESIIKNEGGSKAKIVFYACEYKDATSSIKHPYALMRGDTTDKQKIYRSLHNATIAKVLKDHNESDSIRIFNSTLKPKHKCKALILTHIAYDLLSFNNFIVLDLIESHTGTLKHKHQFYTKFLNGKELVMIPFNEGFLQIFGDSEHFHPLNGKVRKALIDLAIANRWNQITTTAKIISNIDSMTDHFTREILKNILKG